LFDFVNYDTSISNPNLITYNDATANQTKGGVVFISSATGLDEEYSSYFGIQAVSVWHNSMEHTSMLENVQQTYQDIILDETNNSKFCINQLQSTPSYSDIWSSFFMWSLLNKAQSDNLQSVEDSNFSSWLQAMPIVIFDYSTSTYGNFNARVTTLMTTYNLTLSST
jgi:hypothetical protein